MLEQTSRLHEYRPIAGDAVSVPLAQGKTFFGGGGGDRVENGKHVNTQHIHLLTCRYNHQTIIMAISVPSIYKSFNYYINTEAQHTILTKRNHHVKVDKVFTQRSGLIAENTNLYIFFVVDFVWHSVLYQIVILKF